VGVQVHETVEKASMIMRENDFSQLPVFDGERVVGSISETTVLENILRYKDINALKASPVGYLMDEPFPQVDDRTPIDAVLALLKYRYAVLVTKRGKVVGIITKADLLKITSA
jgi:predicted transcriptional regulator